MDSTPVRMKRSRQLRQQLQYRFDERMARSATSVFGALTLAFMAILVVVGVLRAIIVWSFGPEVERGGGPFRQVFLVFLELTDPGSMTQDIDSSPWVKIFTVIAGLAGVVLFSSLIAFITAAVDTKLTELRKGHSIVKETGHILILGWNDRISEILTELVIANESEHRPVVVILADRGKETMDDYLALHQPDTMNTRLVTRAGSTSSTHSLRTVALSDAKSVIILADCNAGSAEADKASSDMSVVKTTLAVVSNLPADSEAPVVAELFHADKRSLARSTDESRVICLDTDAILAKIIVQTSRSVGLSVVYEEVLSFDGAEIYLMDAPELIGLSFGEAMFRMRDGMLIGIAHPNGTMQINPSNEITIEETARLIVLASDDSALSVRPEWQHPTAPGPTAGHSTEIDIERELVIGCNSKLPTLIAEYADYVAPGSRIDVVPGDTDSAALATVSSLGRVGESGLEVRMLDLDPAEVADLQSLNLSDYCNVILLSQDHEVAPEEWIDTETLMVLLQVQRIVRQIPEPERPKLVVEILGSESRELVTSSGVREFVISNRMISMLVAQISETPELEQVYDDLFDEAGSELYLKPASYYFDGLPVSRTFGEIVAAAQTREEIAIGVKVGASEHDADANFGVRLIPGLSETIRLAPDDSIVVVAEDER